MGETRVDILHLLEDLRDAYPGGLEETILTEVVANALDSGATTIAFATDPPAATFTLTDDGSGMARRELARYHDIAATTKTRGRGIGFAGVGIKLGLLAAEEVVTETRRGTTHIASAWRLVSRQRAAWKWIEPPGLVASHGTAVRLRLKEPLSPLLDSGFLAAMLHRHFEPLFDATFETILAPHYPDGVQFLINGTRLGRTSSEQGRAPIRVRIGRKRLPSALGYMQRDRHGLRREDRGIAIGTLGKVILRGWDWLGLSPAGAGEVSGLVEVPALAECLLLNKAEFIRSGPRGRLYLAYRKALQQAVSAQLAAWGDVHEAGEQSRRKKTRPIERDLEAVLVDLADDFPLMEALVERRAGGQRRLPIGAGGDGTGAMAGAVTARDASPDEQTGSDRGEPERPTDATDQASPAEVPELPVPARARGPRRPARYGLRIDFESRPDDPELGRLVESTVWVNLAHPAWKRAESSRSEGYHLALTVAMALAPLVVEPAGVHAFITAFLAKWGETLSADGGRGRR